MKLTDLWSSKGEPPASMSEISLEEFDQKYDLVELVDSSGAAFAIVTEKGGAKLAETDLRELGSTSASPWTSFRRSEYNPALAGLKGYEKFDVMRKSDGTVRGTLRSIKTPALAGRWFIEAAEDTDEAREQAEWVWKNLTEWMSISWMQVLTEALLMLDFGNFMFEDVWEERYIDGKRRIVLQKLAPRHPMDVKEWKFDRNGGPSHVVMFNPFDHTLAEDIVIEINKLLVFSFDREAGNIEGISVLRSAYKHWYFKESLYKIDAIQKERHGIGIPVIKLPMGFKPADKVAAENLGRNIRTNERAHIVLPPGWEVSMLKLEGNPVDALKSVEHHNAAIRENILVNFIGEHARNEDLVMFYKASRFVADIVAETFNLYLIPKMVAPNFGVQECYPKLKVRRIGEVADWRTLSFAVRNFIGAGVIIPDDELEANIRDELDLPIADPSTARLIATPQNPYDDEEGDEEEEDEDAVDDRVGEGDSETHNTNNPNYNRRTRGRKRGKKQNMNKNQVGLPRQTPVGKQKNAFGLPRGNAGRDGGGR
jgi:hypothetical protein